jgi:ATP-dependent helicase/nuclease subunit A
MTRAEKELYLTGCLEIRKSQKDDEGEAHNRDNPPEDFSLLLKNFIGEKIEKEDKKNGDYIPGDSILDNDTFFGLCLPALAAHIPQEGLASGETQPKTFFTIEEIPAFPVEYKRDQKTGTAGFSNDQNGLKAFFEKAEPFYQSAAKIKTPLLLDKRVTPTSLHGSGKAESGGAAENQAEGGGFVINGELSGEDAADVFIPVDSTLARLNKQDEDGGNKFNSGSFGTIAHACVEAMLNGAEPVIPSSLSGFLNPKEADTFLEAGKELAARFIRSPLGVIAANAELRENEFPFRTLLHDADRAEVFINGTIDLLFENNDTVHVVDFKTDNRENPGEHAAQMACYYRAADVLFALPRKKRCRVWLYYLRTGHLVEMTESAYSKFRTQG